MQPERGCVRSTSRSGFGVLHMLRLGLRPQPRSLLCVLALSLFVLVPSGLAASSPLADAAEKADWPRVRTLLKERADASAAQVDGMTALHWAAYHDELDTTKLLLAAGASPKATNRYGVSPLSLACVNGRGAMVETLLAAGANPNTTLRGGETVLMTAARTGQPGPLKALLARGAAVDAKDRKDQTALMWAAAEGHTAAVEVLIKAGANLHARLKSGFTPLLFAVREGRIGVVQSLLKAGVDANEAITTEKGGGKAPDHGTSALILAVENGHFELAVVLLKSGANPNDQRSGFTALHTLTWVRKPNRGDDASGHPPPTGSGNLSSLQFVRELVAHGANVNARLTKGTSGRGKLGMVGATPFLLAARTADLPLMKLLVELGANPLLPNKDGATPLMAAAGLGCHAPTEEAGTEPECVAAVEYLLSLGAGVNTVDANGETAMHGAAYKSLPKIVDLLASKGAKISLWNQKNKAGWTPLLIAEGFRPGNFKPSFETIAALHRVMRAAGVTPPPPTERPRMEPKGYDGAPAGKKQP
ncbi:MAG: ankyrin repeat-containing protein [Limisphaerales bacterium]|nr:MAG: ankyrin repeat-containing protein [Limisphaerales bacterium]KAG0507845.1 MAG: ankyrin repeat-containing protein [Limisphaerales bacterium]TXT48653.1 MAG: ankyrin repeat-containing protein [Limisphaerales bacterium]